MGKADVDVVVEGNDVRVDRKQWRGFWATLTHVVRNAIDHGFETDDERARAGKPATRSLTLRTSVRDGTIVVEVGDDGRGIDWDQVRAKARLRSLSADTSVDLVNAIFSDGISTKDEVTEISGRGVGL